MIIPDIIKTFYNSKTVVGKFDQCSCFALMASHSQRFLHNLTVIDLLKSVDCR